VYRCTMRRRGCGRDEYVPIHYATEVLRRRRVWRRVCTGIYYETEEVIKGRVFMGAL